MTDQPPVVVGEREWDGSLWWSVLVSGGLHLLVIAVVLLVPRRFTPPPPALVSYSVDLIAPDRVGGTNVVAGGKGRVQGPALTTVAPPAPKPPAPPPVEVASKPEPAPPPPAADEPPKVEPKPEPKPEPKVEPKPPPEDKVRADEMALAEKTRKAPSPPPATVAKPVPTVPAKPVPSSPAKPAATAPAKAAPSAKAVAPAPSPKTSQVVAQSTPARSVTPAAKPAARVAAATPGAATDTATSARDARIAAAVRRVEQQVGVHGGGTGQAAGDQPGGPISVGPGEGVGGAVRGFEYLMYYNQLQTRIKQSWAWAGVGSKLEADVRLNIAENGEISNVRTVRSSGDAGFDASVERAVRAVNPLPPPPEAYRKEFADVVLSFSSEQLFQ